MIKKIVLPDKLKITLFYLFIFAFALIAGIHGSSIDMDLYSRFIMGHNILSTGSIMYKDIVSYTPTHTWFDHEWLSSFLMFFIFKYFGIWGLHLLKALLCFSVISLVDLFIVFKQKQFFYKYKSLYLFLVIALLMHIEFFHYTIRCQLFTYAFLPLLIILLEIYRKNANSKTIYYIPLLMLIWLNCHGGSMYGVGVFGLYIIGELILRKPVKKLFIVLAFTFLVYLINPWGIDFVKFMISAIGIDRTYIGEWQSPFTFPPELVVAYVLIQICIISIYIYGQIRNKVNFKTMDYTKLMVLVVTMIIGLRYIKHNATYFLLVSMYLYDEVSKVFDDIVNLFKKFTKKTFSINWILVPVYAGFFIFVLTHYNFEEEYLATIDQQPVYALQFLKDNNIKGKIMVPYYNGGYIAYKCYPDLKIYMDGRQEQVYDLDIFHGLMEFLFYNKKNAESVLEKYPPDIIIAEKYWRGTLFLDSYQSYYKKVYENGVYNVYLAPNVQRFNYKTPQRVPDFSQENFLKSEYFN